VCLGNGRNRKSKNWSVILCFNGAEACASEMAFAPPGQPFLMHRFNGAEACASEMVRPGPPKAD
jgi:hypothetical protein